MLVILFAARSQVPHHCCTGQLMRAQELLGSADIEGWPDSWPVFGRANQRPRISQRLRDLGQRLGCVTVIKGTQDEREITGN
jgi:hypothetical protein